MAFFAEEFGKAFIFKSIRPKIRSFMMKAGYDDVPYENFGFFFYASLLITYLVYILSIYPRINAITTGSSSMSVLLITFISWVLIQLIIIIVMVTYIYLDLNIKIYKRTKEIEKILPDYLQLVSSNLRGGLSFEKAVWAAIRPEFGVISKEITMVYKKVMTGNDLADALREFTNKYESPLLRRSFDLIIGEVESGGEIALIVDKVIENIRKTKALKEEMNASTLTYMIFIGAIVIIVAPGLFALSYYLLTIMAGFSSQLANMNTANMPIQFSPDSINPVDFKIFSTLTLMMASFFSALIVSLIEKGDIKGGIKYIPAFVVSSVVCYNIFLALFGVFFKGLIT
jgi:archaeal flagellar protein FlaJ